MTAIIALFTRLPHLPHFASFCYPVNPVAPPFITAALYQFVDLPDFAALREPEQVEAFLRDLCTPAELEAMADRWKVVPLLQQGVPYREIHERTGVSVTTTGRVARTLEHGHRGYAAAIDRLASR